MKLPRWMHQFYAWALGYFWLPCPICGEPFGGHELKDGDSWYQGNGSGVGVCPKPECSHEAYVRSRKAWTAEAARGVTRKGRDGP